MNKHALDLVSQQLVTWLNQGPENQAQNNALDWPSETWQVFKQVCQVHGVGPFLYKSTSINFPTEISAWLAEQYEFNRQRVNLLHQELAQILAIFAENGLQVMPLKGAILSVDLYPDAHTRPMADLDLLIAPTEFEAATVLLKNLGYQQDVVHWKHTEFIKPDNQVVVSKTSEHPQNPRPVELHPFCRETFGGPTLDLTEAMWASARPGLLLGQPAMLPSPEMFWLHLLVHASYHFWQGRGRLIQLLDLYYLTPQLTDLESHLNQVDARYTYPALSLLHRTFPQAIDSALVTSQAQRLTPAFRTWADGLNLVQNSYLGLQPSGLYLKKALHFAQGHPQEVLQALRFSLLPNLNELSLDHPRLAQSPWPWLAYFLLPLDWLKRLTGKTRS